MEKEFSSEIVLFIVDIYKLKWNGIEKISINRTNQMSAANNDESEIVCRRFGKEIERSIAYIGTQQHTFNANHVQKDGWS